MWKEMMKSWKEFWKCEIVYAFDIICKDGIVSFVSNARDRNQLNLHLGVFPLLKVVDHAIGDVFIVTIQDKTCHGHQLQLLPFPSLGFSETY